MKNRVIDGNLHKWVIQILLDRPEMRDSDSRLIAYIWFCEARQNKIDLQQSSALDFLKKLKSEVFTSCESIQRSRRKAQERFPELRGKKYRDRQAKETTVRRYFHGN